MVATHYVLACVLALGPLSGLAAAQTSEPATAQAKIDLPAGFNDQPLKPYRKHLLDLAFSTASSMPLHPHIKDRSRREQEIVEGALTLNQPETAMKFGCQVSNWRRGMAYSAIALYCARHGEKQIDALRPLLDEAVRIAKLADQDWRKHRVYVNVAKTYYVLGDEQMVDALTIGAEDSEQCKVERIRAESADDERFAERLEAIDAMLRLGTFDQVKAGLQAYVALFGTFYADADRRRMIESRIKAGWTPMPLLIRIDLVLDLADQAIANDDRKKAGELVSEAKQIVDSATWPVDYYIPLCARLADYQFRVGDKQAAAKSLAETVAKYDESRDQIQSFERAEVLRPVAEAMNVVGTKEQTLALYRRVVEEGNVNPNARTRANDLARTCLSMAIHDIEPDEELWALMREIKTKLVAPW